MTSSLVIYSADLWHHACMVVRLVSPAKRAGYRLLPGAEWVNGALQVFPERAGQADVVVITRDFPSRVVDYEQVMAEARSSSKAVVYETDDLLLELPERHPDFERYLAARAAMLQAIVEADVVVGSTVELCDYLRAFNPTTVLWENHLDDQLWRLAPPPVRSNGLVYVGYMGGQSHADDLGSILPALLEVLHKYPGKIRLKFWGLEPPTILCRRTDVEYDPVGLVDYRSFAAYFSDQKCDIFVAPLQDNLFNRCKSHLKFLEYSALAVPGVYSRIGSYQRLVQHGQNGFLAGEPEQWVQCLGELIEDASLRARMGMAAQETLQSGWLLDGHLDRFDYVYSAVSRGRSGSRPCQDGETPHLATRVAQKMGTFYGDMLRLREENRRLKLRLDLAQANMAEKERAMQELERAAQGYYALYWEIIDSRSWRLMQRLIRLRLRLAPRGGRTEQLFRTIYLSAAALKKQGIRAALRAAWEKHGSLGQQPADLAQVASLPSVSYRLLTSGGAVCSLPAISVIVIDVDQGGCLAVEDVHAWVQKQTLRAAAQVVLWNQKIEQAGVTAKSGVLTLASESWPAPDVPSLLQGIRTPYICLASLDLLKQEATFLEVNLCALQTESLAFTLNLQGNSPQMMRRLEQGRLPGNQALPLLRQVVHKECVASDFSLDLRGWLDRRKIMPGEGEQRQDAGVVVGRIITQTTSLAWPDDDLPFDHPSDFACLIQDGHFISPLAALDPSQFATAASHLYGWVHLLLPLGQAMPAVPEPCDLPTVFLVMPFLAVGGAEKIALKVMQNLAGQVRFVVLTFDALDAALGSMVDAFRQVTPYVYTLPDFTQSQLNASVLDYLIARFTPRTIYIANGSPWIYDALGEIKCRYPSIRLVNQVYDHQVGWINRYDAALVLYLDVHIGSNSRICQAYRQKGVREEQIYFIENGTDSQELDPARYDDRRVLNLKTRFGLPAQARVVTFASRLHPQKRPLDFIELARRFKNDPGVAFLMAGDGPLAAQVGEQIDKSGLTNLSRIPFYQPISDLLAVTDVLVLPSEFEGMPMIVLEAQTMGKPVVVTNVGNNRETLERTQGGVVLDQMGDISTMMRAVRHMLDQPPEPELLRRRTLAFFDWKAVAQKYLEALLG